MKFFKVVFIFIKNIIRRTAGIHSDASLYRDLILRSYGLRWQKFWYKRHFSTEELIQVMKSLGMREGSTIFIHCSWNAFFNFSGTPKQLIDAILDVIGDTGTLAMPAFPLYRDKIFNLKRSPTGGGILAETFRRYPNVKRSINVQHSVCAVGPNSDYLLNEHHLGNNCLDEKSPYYRLCEVDALIFNFGLGYSWLGTSYHCVESVNASKIKYYADFFSNEKTVHKYIDYDGVEKTYECYDFIAERGYKIIPEKWFLYRYLSKEDYKHARISNLTISCYNAKTYIPKLINLGIKGIDIYRKPSKKGYKFCK